ncbi:hypothetical protein EVAR_14839_1 [Eumeta japonica]|uniref:Uncharacterized protein n=1 Tax=Eumeta variegata TaxID=151549 RepID=A0A4C1V2X4_EUMVA|nr:hypothetical protein EVAR_14839_1 [Eumeta japonica]
MISEDRVYSCAFLTGSVLNRFDKVVEPGAIRPFVTSDPRLTDQWASERRSVSLEILVLLTNLLTNFNIIFRSELIAIENGTRIAIENGIKFDIVVDRRDRSFERGRNPFCVHASRDAHADKHASLVHHYKERVKDVCVGSDSRQPPTVCESCERTEDRPPAPTNGARSRRRIHPIQLCKREGKQCACADGESGVGRRRGGRGSQLPPVEIVRSTIYYTPLTRTDQKKSDLPPLGQKPGTLMITTIKISRFRWQFMWVLPVMIRSIFVTITRQGKFATFWGSLQIHLDGGLPAPCDPTHADGVDYDEALALRNE